MAVGVVVGESVGASVGEAVGEADGSAVPDKYTSSLPVVVRMPPVAWYLSYAVISKIQVSSTTPASK
jgi:hypothetical protein